MPERSVSKTTQEAKITAIAKAIYLYPPYTWKVQTIKASLKKKDYEQTSQDINVLHLKFKFHYKVVCFLDFC